MKAVTIKVHRAGDGWRGIVQVDGEEYARVFTSSYATALEAAIPYARAVADEAVTA